MTESEHSPEAKSAEARPGGAPVWLDRALLLAVMVYCALPTDLIPHEAGALGNVDDMTLIAGILAYLWKKPKSAPEDMKHSGEETA